jgi:MarR family transcriptional regulator for hemolysin
MTGRGDVEFLGRRLTHTAKAVRAYADSRMAEAGSSLTVAIVTRVLTRRPGLTQRELADELGIEGPTIARHLERLERDGVVRRVSDDTDRRVLRVDLTDEGRVLRDRLLGVSRRTHDELVAVFTATELARFEEYLERVATHASTLDRNRRRP